MMVQPKPRGLLTNSAFALAGDVAAKGGMFIALVLAAHALPTAEFARLGVAMAIVLILTSVLDAGCATVIIRDGARSALLRHALLRSSVTARLPLAAVTAAAMIAAGVALGQPWLAVVCAISVVVNAAQLTALAGFRAAQTLAVEAVTKLAVGIASQVSIVIGAELHQRTALGALTALTVVPAASVPMLTARLRRYRAGEAAPVRALRLLRAGAPFAAMAVSTLVYYRSGTVMLGWLRSSTETAEYANASTLAFGLLMLPMALATTLLPRLSASADARVCCATLQRALRVSTGAFLALAAIVFVSASKAVPFVYGARYRGSVMPLLILTGAGVMISASCVIGTGLIAAGRTRSVLVQVLVATGVNLTANGILIPSFGTAGATVSTVLTELFSLLFLAVACERAIPGVLLPRRLATTTAFHETSTA